MKIRNGFVSNSSSSSFLVAFDKKPKNVLELHKVMFGTKPTTVQMFDYSSYSSLEVAKTVWNSLEEQKPLTEKEIQEEAGSGYFEGYPETDYTQDTESHRIEREAVKVGKDAWKDEPWKTKRMNAWNAEWEKREKEIDKCAEQYYLKTVKPLFKGKKVFKFSYSDNDGEYYTTLEHGDIFGNLPHVCISHH